MARIACTHVAMGWIGGVLYSRVARTRSCFRGPEGRLVYVVGNPQLGYNRFESSLLSVMETQLTVHHRS